MANYAIETLTKERGLLLKAIDGWSQSSRQQYKEAFKIREKRLAEINQAIETLKAKS